MSLDPEFEAAAWNMGIAATALSQWQAARQAWRAYGIAIDETHGAEDEELRLFASNTPIRIHGDSIEVVWCTRIDPARAIIDSIPTPGSGFACGDLVLHDGAPNGYRMSRGRELAVFDAMTLLKPSDLKTFDVLLRIPADEDFGALEKACVDAALPMEDWSTLRYLCKACSEGRPHDTHDHSPQGGGDVASPETRSIVFAASEESTVRTLIQRWATAERYLIELKKVFEHPATNE